MKIWKKYDIRPLSMAQEAERRGLRLDPGEYKLLLFIRSAGDEGASWGSLPSHPSTRLVSAGLVHLRGGAVRVTSAGRAK